MGSKCGTIPIGVILSQLPCRGNVGIDKCNAPNHGCEYEQQVDDFRWKCTSCNSTFISPYAVCTSCGAGGADYVGTA